MIPRAEFLVDISSRYLTGNLLCSTQQEKQMLLKTLNGILLAQTGNKHLETMIVNFCQEYVSLNSKSK